MILNNFVISAIKKTAQNNYPIVAKREKIQKQIEELTAKKEELEQKFMELSSQITVAETGIKALTGYTSDQLVTRVEGTEDKRATWELNPSFITSNGDGTYELHQATITEPINGHYEAPEAVEAIITPGNANSVEL